MSLAQSSELEPWQRLADESGLVLMSPAWQQHLASSLGASCHFIADADGRDGVVLQIFARGPFRAAYAGFPIGGTVLGSALGAARVQRIVAAQKLRKPHVLRLTSSAFGPTEENLGVAQHVPETCIVDLASCKPHEISKVRHDLSRARRAGVEVRVGGGDEIAQHICATYASTVSRHGGAAKYGSDYFAGLVKLAASEPRLRVLTSWVGGVYAGYVVLALHGTCAYYLHAGVNPEFQKTGAGDLLLAEAIAIAQQAGMQSFNMMASPAAQPGLIKFKEKWGAVTRPQTVQTVTVNAPMAALMKLAEKAYKVYAGLRGG